MTSGLVHLGYSLPKGQAGKLNFFVPCGISGEQGQGKEEGREVAYLFFSTGLKKNKLAQKFIYLLKKKITYWKFLTTT